MFLAELNKVPQVALTAPVEDTFGLLVMDPDDVAGDDLNSGGLHFEDLLLPLRLWIAGVVELAHDGEPGLAVEGEVLGVDADG